MNGRKSKCYPKHEVGELFKEITKKNGQYVTIRDKGTMVILA